jgi:hypothetical protein
MRRSQYVQPGWYLPLQKIPLAENRFLQAGKGAENTKEKSRQCFTHRGGIVVWANGTDDSAASPT